MNGRIASHLFPVGDTGTYMTTLIVRNTYGCVDTVSLFIDVRPEFSFFIPNCFTPNGDEANEAFFGSGTGIKKYHLMIFDRWGDLIWQTEDIHQGWMVGRTTGSSFPNRMHLTGRSS
jgi:gliding motility-associated-like protein